MKKVKTSALLLLSALSLGALASCGGNGYKVDFKVLIDSNTWATVKTVETVGGKVEVPEAPAKLYYDFGGWYNEDTFATSFVSTGIDKDTSAYGKYVAQEVTIHIDDDEPVVKKLEDVANTTVAPKEGLIFNGWYKDAALQVQWNGKDSVTDLYAANMAMLTFNNGYEDVYTVMVPTGSKFADPSKQSITVDGTATTLEKKEIVESYMDEDDIHYVDSEGNPFNFDKAITKNETVTVNFNTIGLKKYVKYNKTTNKYVLQPMMAYDMDGAPVLSMQDTYTIDVTNEAGETVKTPVKVEAIDIQGDDVMFSSMTKIIIGEGIKSIGGINDAYSSEITEIVLPKSLKIIDNCFNNFNNLQSVELPDGLEVLIASFHKNAMIFDSYKHFVFGENHDFDITVPASVKNMAMVPTNFKFAEGSNFAFEDGRIVLNEGDEKILIADNDHINDSTIVVPKNITKIQAGTYPNAFDYMILPATFKNVNYNANIAKYPFYNRDGANPSPFHLFDETTLGKDTTQMAREAFAISPMLGGYKINDIMSGKFHCDNGYGIVKFDGNTVPATMDATAFTGDTTGLGWMNNAYQPSNDPQLNKYLVTDDGVDKIYISLRLPVTDSMYTKYFSYRTSIDSRKINNVNELVEAVKADPYNSGRVEEINKYLGESELGIFCAGEEITVDKISGEMFLTLQVKAAE